MKIIVLVGKTACGKNTILEGILEQLPMLHKVVTCTTRSPRVSEEDGKDYVFLHQSTFNEKIKNGTIFEHTTYTTSKGTFSYGMSINTFSYEKNNIIIADPKGVEVLREKFGEENVLPILIYRNAKDRFVDALNRQSGNLDYIIEEVKKRMQEDEDKFRGFYLHHYVDNDSLVSSSVNKCVKIIRDELVIKEYEKPLAQEIREKFLKEVCVPNRCCNDCIYGIQSNPPLGCIVQYTIDTLKGRGEE